MQGKVHQQLRLAYDNEIRQIWVFNVGDIKPMELPLTFALALAWNIDSIQSKSVPDFYREYSIREFGPQHATETSQLLLEHDSLMALRRHEHIEPYVFSVLNYREADTVVSRYKAAEKHATNLMEIMPPNYAASPQIGVLPTGLATHQGVAHQRRITGHSSQEQALWAAATQLHQFIRAKGAAAL